MKLYLPTKGEAAALVHNPPMLNGMKIEVGALPPGRLFELAAVNGASAWIMPRLFIDEEARKVIGSGGFKGAPIRASVEIGYNVAPEFRSHGCGTEGVLRLCAEAFTSGSVEEIVAEAEIANAASQRVLEKAGFTAFDVRTDDEGAFRRWRLKKAIARPNGPTA
jgi:RimJ/RimL family protein N-acetyltransferase